jgi:hypothetical protein
MYIGGLISVLIAGIANDWNYDRWTGDADKRFVLYGYTIYIS